MKMMAVLHKVNPTEPNKDLNIYSIKSGIVTF